MVSPKYEMIIMLSNFSCFQYCDNNIRIVTIAPCTVIALDILGFIFGISPLLLFFIALFIDIDLSTTTIAIGFVLSRPKRR